MWTTKIINLLFFSFWEEDILTINQSALLTIRVFVIKCDLISRDTITMFKLTSHQDESSSSFEIPQPCRQLTFSEIQLATQNFDESLVIGRGGFGKVYKGTITYGENLLTTAIKRLESTSNQGAVEFRAEVKMLSNLRHCHLVSLIGSCNDGQEMVLVYEYMPRGTLEDHLHKRQSTLSWIRRLKICIGAARGLDYLHTGTGIKHGVIHRDVKSSNILLDESWAAKISDFGLSKICPTNPPSTYVNTLVKGTFGYLDPDYYSTGRLTRKSDVYAFGVVLFEILCGKRAVDRTLDEEQWGLASWAQDSIKEGRLKQIVDSNIRGRISPKCLKEFAQLADRCLHSHPKKRPTMAEVVVGLEFVLALQEKANKTLRTAGMKLFGRKVPMFVFPYNWENSVELEDGDRSLTSLEQYLDVIQDENQIFHRFDFDSINVATEKFSEANKFPCDDYYDMYKGRLQNGQDIAIAESSNKRYKRSHFLHEVSILLKLEHDNLVKLLGYCIEGTKLFLIFEFAVHASLDCLIFDPVSTLLDCNKRYKIILGVARVLLYLHKHAPIRIIHCGVNPRNIILDESLDPKLSNFRLATVINEKDCIHNDVIHGSLEYGAPEYLFHSHLSTKADVYSFGVLVLTTITGHRVFDLIPGTIENVIHNVGSLWLEGTYSNMIDPRLDANSSLITRLVEIGVFCTQDNREDRPTMEEVVDMLLGTSSLMSEMRARARRGISSLVSEMGACMMINRGCCNDTSEVEECKWLINADDYDTSAAEEFIADLYPR